MAEAVADLLVRIDATTEMLRRELKNSEDRLNSFERVAVSSSAKVSGAIERASSLSIKALGALGIAFGVNEIIDYGKRALETAGSLGTMATQIGVTAKTLQLLQFASLQTGVAQDQMQAGIANYTRKLGEAQQGNNAAIASFDRMGIAVRDKVTGEARTADDAIGDLADRIKNAKSPTEQATLAFEGFGKTGQRMLPIMAQGAAGLEDLGKKAKQVGFILNDSIIEAADKTNSKFQMLGATLQRNMARVIVGLSPELLALGEAAERALPKMAAFLDQMLPDDLKPAEALEAELAAITKQLNNNTKAAEENLSIRQRLFNVHLRRTDQPDSAPPLSPSQRTSLQVRAATLQGLLANRGANGGGSALPEISPVADEQRAAELRMQTAKLDAQATTATIEKKLELARTVEMLTVAYTHYQKEQVDAFIATGKWPPELEALRASLAKIDADKLAGDLARFTQNLKEASAARQRLAEAAGLGEAAERQADNANAVASARRDSAARAAAVSADNEDRERQARLSIMNETVRTLTEQKNANDNMAAAVMQGTLAVRNAARAEYEHQAQLRLGKSATVELTAVMAAYDAAQKSALQLEQARILASAKLRAAQILAVNDVRRQTASDLTMSDGDRERAIRQQERLNEASERFGGLTSKNAEAWLKTQAAIDESEISTRELEERMRAAHGVVSDLGGLFNDIASGDMSSILDSVDHLLSSMDELNQVGGSFADQMEAAWENLKNSTQAGNGLANLLGKAMGRSDQQNQNAKIGGQAGGFIAQQLGLPKGIGSFIGNLLGGLFGGKSVGPTAQAYASVDSDVGCLKVPTADNKQPHLMLITTNTASDRKRRLEPATRKAA